MKKEFTYCFRDVTWSTGGHTIITSLGEQIIYNTKKRKEGASEQEEETREPNTLMTRSMLTAVIDQSQIDDK